MRKPPKRVLFAIYALGIEDILGSQSDVNFFVALALGTPLNFTQKPWSDKSGGILRRIFLGHSPQYTKHENAQKTFANSSLRPPLESYKFVAAIPPWGMQGMPPVLL